MPDHLRDSNAAASRMTGAGKGYEYPHAHGGYVNQDYLPEAIRDKRLYEAIRGREKELEERIAEEREAQEVAGPRGRDRVPG